MFRLALGHDGLHVHEVHVLGVGDDAVGQESLDNGEPGHDRAFGPTVDLDNRPDRIVMLRHLNGMIILLK